MRDERGFVLTGPDLRDGHLDGWPLKCEPFLLEASAVGEGSVAVHFMHQHLASL